MNDFSRQHDLFDPSKFNTPVTIIGGGATGSWVALELAKLGIKDITLYDFDTIEEHNLPNQAFTESQVGMKKVDAVAQLCKEFSGTQIKVKNMRVDGKQPLNGIVFMLTDTMSSRKEIWNAAIKFKPSVNLLIETRMGLREGRVYAINPCNPDHIREYEKTLYSDEETPVSACGTSQSVVVTAMMIASWAVWQLILWSREEPFDNEMLVYPSVNQVFAKKF